MKKTKIILLMLMLYLVFNTFFYPEAIADEEFACQKILDKTIVIDNVSKYSKTGFLDKLNLCLHRQLELQENQSDHLPSNLENKTTHKIYKLSDEGFKYKYDTRIILPLKYNDRSNIDKGLFKSIEDFFLMISGGFTKYKTIGKYKSSGGKIYNDHNISYEILIEPDKVSILRKYAQYLKILLDQESIYLDISEVYVNFVD